MYIYMGGCQNYGPFLGTLNMRCRTVLGTQKGTITLTTTHIKTHTPRLNPDELARNLKPYTQDPNCASPKA